MFRYQGDVSLWLSYIDFLKRIKKIGKVSAIYVRMLAVHGDKPEIWIAAAKWEMEKKKSPEIARKLLLRGLKRHPGNLQLFLAHFRMELMYVDSLRKKKEKEKAEEDSSDEDSDEDEPKKKKQKKEEDEDDEILNCALVKIVGEEAIKECPRGEEACVALLGAAREFEFAKDVRDWLVEMLEREFRGSELAWDTRARRQLDKEAYEGAAPKLGVRVRNCLDVYETALEEKDTELMWKLYLDTVADIEAASLAKSGADRGLYLSALKRAVEAEKLGVDHCWRLVEKLEGRKEIPLAIQAVRGVVSRLPLSDSNKSHLSKLLTTELELLAKSGTGVEKVGAEFLKMLRKYGNALGSEAREVCSSVSEYLRGMVGKEEEEAVKKVYGQCLGLESKYSGCFKGDYLEWTAETQGIQAARKVYKKISGTPPYSKECYEAMIKLESESGEQSAVKNERIRRIYEDYVTHFGGECSVWTDYVSWADREAGWETTAEVKCRAAKALKGAELERYNYYLVTDQAEGAAESFSSDSEAEEDDEDEAEEGEEMEVEEGEGEDFSDEGSS